MNNLPMKRENGIIGKIKKFFRKLFFRNKDNNDISENNFLNEIRVKEEYNNDKTNIIKIDDEKEKYLDEIYKNPKLLYAFSTEKLKKLEKYYKISINHYQEMIKKTQSANY